jgi:hypothetical protein
MIFRLCSLLKKQLTPRIKDEYRKGPMEFPLLVRVYFFPNADFLVSGIQQDHVCFHTVLSPVESLELRAGEISNFGIRISDLFILRA